MPTKVYVLKTTGAGRTYTFLKSGTAAVQVWGAGCSGSVYGSASSGSGAFSYQGGIAITSGVAVNYSPARSGIAISRQCNHASGGR